MVCVCVCMYVCAVCVCVYELFGLVALPFFLFIGLKSFHVITQLGV